MSMRRETLLKLTKAALAFGLHVCISLYMGLGGYGLLLEFQAPAELLNMPLSHTLIYAVLAFGSIHGIYWFGSRLDAVVSREFRELQARAELLAAWRR